MAEYEYFNTIANSISTVEFAFNLFHVDANSDSSLEGVLEYSFSPTLNSNSSVPVDDPVGELTGYAVNSNSSILGDLVYDRIGNVNSNSSIIPLTEYAIGANTILNSNSSIVVFYETISVLVDLACYVLNMDTGRTVEFANYGFLGYGRFNQKLCGIKATGLYDLETVATDDDGTDIAASFEIKSDFEMPNYKRFRGIYVEGGDVKITITDESGKVIAYNITVEEFRSLPKNTRDKAFTIKVENINGEKITLRRLHGDLDIFPRKGV